MSIASKGEVDQYLDEESGHEGNIYIQRKFRIIMNSRWCKTSAWTGNKVLSTLCRWYWSIFIIFPIKNKIYFLLISGLVDPAETLSIPDGPYWVPERWHPSRRWYQGKPELGTILWEPYMRTSSKIVSVHQSPIIYNVFIHCTKGKCRLKVILFHSSILIYIQAFGELSEQKLRLV